MPYWLKKFWDLPKNNFVKGPFNPRQKVMWASTLSPFSLTGCLSISMLCLQIVWVFSLVFTQWPSVGSLDLAVFSSCKVLLIKISFPGLVAFMLAETSYYNVSANSINLQGYQAKKIFFFFNNGISRLILACDWSEIYLDLSVKHSVSEVRRFAPHSCPQECTRKADGSVCRPAPSRFKDFRSQDSWDGILVNPGILGFFRLGLACYLNPGISSKRSGISWDYLFQLINLVITIRPLICL